MATIEYWIQIENHPWDACPHNIDRMTGRTIQEINPRLIPVPVTLTSPVSGASLTRTMFYPLRTGDAIEDALILRRYTADWKEPDDRKVNPWDLNEPDPTDNGTMGTIPGPTLECNVGDNVIVHFRNMDSRSGKKPVSLTHSLHPHGFVFASAHDGAYPLSPPDPSQPVGSESAAWASIGVSEFKKGDRVPPGATFVYNWQTLGWPTTAGVWLYHDHSVCDTHNVELGAIGIIVIHNTADANDVIDPDLPNNSHIGFPLDKADPPRLIPPPSKAQYLQLFHELGSAMMCINGRKYMGNTPTMVAGTNTTMRFGVVGMGNFDGFHTFHIHGHRWIIPGPDGNTSDSIQNSTQVAAASQFEDTRTFGPANSFSFTAHPGSFMRALPPELGEWHMHCHVLNHMMDGMMGTLLIGEEGQILIPKELPQGVLCPEMAGGHGGHGEPKLITIVAKNNQWDPDDVTVASGTTIAFDFQEPNHTVVTSSHPNASEIVINSGGGPFDGIPEGQIVTRVVTGSSGGMIHYNCGIHGQGMDGVITIS